MPYISAETTELRDRVSDSGQRSGTVMYIMYNGNATELIVEWDDGTIGIHYQPEDLVLIKRAPAETISLSR